MRLFRLFELNALRRQKLAGTAMPSLFGGALAITGVALLLAAIVILHGWQRAHFLLERGGMAHQQLEQLAHTANRIDGYLSLIDNARAGDPTLEAERIKVDRALDVWKGSVERELAMLRTPVEVDEERTELERISRIRALLTRAEDVLLARREPIWVTRGYVDALMSEAIADERSEVGATSAALIANGRKTATLAIGLPLVALAIAGLLNLLVARTLRQRLRHLMAGATAIGGGDLGYRFNQYARDDLGLLAAKFDLMATRLERGRRRLSDLHQQLESKVAERTGELEGKNRQLERIDASREAFFSEISHELRTPLTALRGEAEIALRDEQATAANQRQAFTHIVTFAEDLARNIDDLMALARSRARELALVSDHFLFSDTVRRAVTAARALARPRGLSVDLASALPACPGWGDAGRLQQAFMAVLDNAIAHSPRGGTVRVELSERPSAGLYNLTVEDDGAGIPRADRRRVFTAFTRGQSSREGGLGLGLAIAQRIVAAHGGRIDISVKGNGCGTQVRIALPIHMPGAPALGA